MRLTQSGLRHFAPVVAFFLSVGCVLGQVVQPPAEISFLSDVASVRKDIAFEAWTELKFLPDSGPGEGVPRQGKHWTLLASIPNQSDVKAAWNAVKPAFLKNGWTAVKEFPSGAWEVTVKYAQKGVEAWALLKLSIDSPGVGVRLEVLELAPPPISLTLAAPAAAPEPMPSAENGNFPYLAPLPGSVTHRGGVDNAPFLVVPKGATQAEVVATGSLFRRYSLAGLSGPLLVTVYRDALTKAGWDIVNDKTVNNLTVHYGQKGRNIWAHLSTSGDDYGIEVADSGTEFGATLAKTCHVALYGVLFDFNKSTLQAASDAVLQQVATLLAADKTLQLEVQGHTDNVGADAYNQTLSNARAQAVLTWLTQHAAAPDRLTAKGYGKTVPVADNGSEEGRAKNRRVEIADPRCVPKGK